MINMSRFLTILLLVISAPVVLAQEFEGYLVYDEEMVGFYPCGGGEPFGIDYSGDLDIRLIYQNLKTYLREPLYFKVSAEPTEFGEYGWGLIPEPASSYLKITEIKLFEKHESVVCGAIIPGSNITEFIREP